MKKRVHGAILAALFPTIAVADCASHICSEVHVDKIYTNVDGLVYVATTGDETKLDCVAESGVYVSFHLSDPAGDAIYSTLLASQLADRKVAIRIARGTAGCKIAYITHDRQ